MRSCSIRSGIGILGALPAQIRRIASSNLKLQNRPQSTTAYEGEAVKSEKWPQTRARHLALTGLVVGTVLFRIGVVLALPRVIKWDEPAYLLIGRNLLTERGLTTGLYPELHFTPFYGIISGTFYLLVGDFEWASNFAYALFGGLLLIPVFSIARRIYGLQTAWLACVLLAIFPALTVSVLYWGTMTEPLYLFLIYAGLAALLAGLEDNRPWLLAAAGAFFGLAYLTRPEAVIYFGLFLIFGVVWLTVHPTCLDLRSMTRSLLLRVVSSAKRTCLTMGCFALPFVVLAAPYVLYLHKHTGFWMLTGKAAVLGIERSATKLDPNTHELLWLSPDRFNSQQSLSRAVLGNFDELGFRVIRNVQKLRDMLFDRYVFWYGRVSLVSLGLFVMPWDQRRLGHEVFLVAALVPVLLVVLPFHVLVRFLAPMFPVLLIWTARGAVTLGTWLQETVQACREKPVQSRYMNAVLTGLPGGVVMLLFLATLPGVARAGYADTIFGYKEAGLWLRTHSASEARLMTQALSAALYADRPWVPVPDTDWASFIGYARSHNASYLIVDTHDFPKNYPQIAFLSKTAAPELELVFSFQEPGRRTLVYHFMPRLAQN